MFKPFSFKKKYRGEYRSKYQMLKQLLLNIFKILSILSNVSLSRKQLIEIFEKKSPNTKTNRFLTGLEIPYDFQKKSILREKIYSTFFTFLLCRKSNRIGTLSALIRCTTHTIYIYIRKQTMSSIMGV